LNILITGGAGYVGTVLVEHLLNEGYNVTCLDRFFFGDEYLKKLSNENPLTLVKDDIRWFNPKILEGKDAVLDLAAISDDPGERIDSFPTYDINYLGRARVARLSKKFGVKKYILASSMSVYGFQDHSVNEESKIAPISVYAKSHAKAEKDILSLREKNFSVTALRFSTVYGLSPKMRFDLAVNGMTLNIFKNGIIPLRGDGKQWRPFIHIKDVSRIYQTVLESEPSLVSGEIFNCGADNHNYQIDELAKTIASSLKVPYKIEKYGIIDKRSYVGNFDKINDILKFEPKSTPGDAAIEIYDALKSGKVDYSLYTYTILWYKHLIETNQLLQRILIKDTIL